MLRIKVLKTVGLVVATGPEMDVVELIVALSRTDALRYQWRIYGEGNNYTTICWPMKREE
jgi:hypothetical protein